MAAGECSAETFNSQSPLMNKKMIFINAQAAVNSDYVTVTKLTTVQGAFLQCIADGTVATCTIATNVITITNAGNKAWVGFCWGV